MQVRRTINPRRSTSRAFIVFSAIGLAAWAADQHALAQQQPPLVPTEVTLNEAVQQAIDAPWLTEEERAALRVFHGVWTEADLTDVEAQAIVALNAWDFNHPSLTDDAVAVELRGEAGLRAGTLREVIELLVDTRTNRASRIIAEAYEALGDQQAADDAVDAPVTRLLNATTEDADELTEGVRALIVRTRVQGHPAHDYQTMMGLLARAHQELDRLYWPARLTEAQLLIDKDNQFEAVGALHETLALNPRCAQAWYELGRLALRRFDFRSSVIAAQRLMRLNPSHPLGVLLTAESRILQDDPDGAIELLHPLIDRLPQLRPARALLAGAHAVQYDEAAMRAALSDYEELSPGSAQAYFVVGRSLSLARQYEAAAEMLEQAVRRQPAWPAPQIELGLLELQSGRDLRALTALERVVELDPFNKRAANSLFLLQELAQYSRIETEHFVIRYKPGIDEVMVVMMPEVLERLHADVSARFQFEPDQKTVIELMPDHGKFAVRISGMPWIHTIAACTGPVIAIEVPRDGPPSQHLGTFDWPRVIRHEYTHTITLGQTRNRIPHWLTEAAAVSMEQAPRDYKVCVSLASAYNRDALFNLDEIKWAFIRPKRPGDRSLAYAQGHWMVEYMDERFGSSALIRLLELYFEGVRETDAMPQALGVSRDDFFDAFLVWAQTQLQSWGLAAEPDVEQLMDELRMADPELAEALHLSKKARLAAIARRLAEDIGAPKQPGDEQFTGRNWPELIRPPVTTSDEQLDEWLVEYPDHPDLLRLKLRREIAKVGDTDASLIPLLEQYAAARPVDPYPHKRLAAIYKDDEPDKAIEHLEALDIREQKTPVYALALSQMYRAQGDYDRAVAKATRALQINPYHAQNRELAAAIAIEAGQLEIARSHLHALTLIEPDRPQHERRLEAIDRMIGQPRQ